MAELPLEPVLRPLLLHSLLRGDNTLGMSTFTPDTRDRGDTLEPAWQEADPGSLSPLIPCTEARLLSLLLRRSLFSWLSHSESEDTGRPEDRDRGMLTPSPGTPDTPDHRPPLVSSLTMSEQAEHSVWPAPASLLSSTRGSRDSGPGSLDCPSCLVSEDRGCSPRAGWCLLVCTRSVSDDNCPPGPRSRSPHPTHETGLWAARDEGACAHWPGPEDEQQHMMTALHCLG